jgi:hypothetical protein
MGGCSEQKIEWHEIQDATSRVVFKEHIWKDGNVDEGMASANTRIGVHSIFVAVGMNKRIIHLNHASIIEMEFSCLIRVEELCDVAGVRWRRTEWGRRKHGRRAEMNLNRKKQGGLVCSLFSSRNIDLQSSCKRYISAA